MPCLHTIDKASAVPNLVENGARGNRTVMSSLRRTTNLQRNNACRCRRCRWQRPDESGHWRVEAEGFAAQVLREILSRSTGTTFLAVAQMDEQSQDFASRRSRVLRIAFTASRQQGWEAGFGSQGASRSRCDLHLPSSCERQIGTIARCLQRPELENADGRRDKDERM